MSLKMNKDAYKNLIAGDIEWLEKQPHSLEKDHILCVLDASPDMHYPKKKDAVAASTDEAISINLPLSINIDDIRNQLGAVTAAHDRQILYQNQINDLSSIVDLLDIILEKAINAKQQRGKNAE